MRIMIESENGAYVFSTYSFKAVYADDNGKVHLLTDEEDIVLAPGNDAEPFALNIATTVKECAQDTVIHLNEGRIVHIRRRDSLT